MATVHGFVHDENGSPALGATVRVYDKDFRSEELLGEAVVEETSGRYLVTYTVKQYRRAEQKTADLLVRATAPDGARRVQSAIAFNARDEERVDLTFGPPPADSRRSELERLQEAIEPVRKAIDYRDFIERDFEFLSHEAARRNGLDAAAVQERRTLQARLRFLSRADRFAEQTGIRLEAFYGWYRMLGNQHHELDALLDMPSSRLRRALEQAIDQNVIPDIRGEIAQILERVRALPFERGRTSTRHFVGRLIGVADDSPEHRLSGNRVDVVDRDAGDDEQDARTVFSDGSGLFVFTFTVPLNAPSTVVRRLHLTIRAADRIVGEIEVNATTPQEEVTEIRVRLQADERGTTAIETVAPEALTGRLRAQGILTLRDLLDRPAVVDDADPEGLERVRGAARFAVLAPELSEPERERLLDEGFRGPVDLAASPRAAFVENHHEQLGGDAATYVTHFAAREARKVLHHMIGGAWFEVVGSPGDDEIDPDIPPGVVDTLNDQKTCGCSDCKAAVGPAAYLASLLEWTLEHTRSQGDSITLAQLGDEFHQPFAALPATCEAVEQPVRLVRLCVEALWRFTGLRDRTDLQLAFSFRNSYRDVRDRLYEQILINLGVGFEQLRKATLQIPADSPFADVVATHRRTVADVLGIDESHVGDLFFNIDLSPGSPTSPTEVALQALFGFRSTRLENVFDALETPELIAWQRERLEAIWKTQDWSIDVYSGDGRLPFVDPAIIDASYLRTTLDGNPAGALLQARQQDLAAHRQTLVDANPQANGLAGFLANELGSSIEELRALVASLQASDAPEQVVQAEQAIAALHLTPAGLTRLMDIDARLQEGEPIGATEEEIDAAWASVFDVLSRRHRHSLFPTWIDEEQEQEIVLGPRHFWLPVKPATPLNPWQATAAERSAWEEAFGRRSRAPIVDPDQIAKSYVIAILSFSPSFVSPMLAFHAPFMPPLTAFQLWEERRAWVDARIELLRQSRQGQATALGSFGAMLEASTLGIGLDVFTELADLETAGDDLKPRLAQLGFSLQAHRALVDVHLLAVGGASVSIDQWQAVEAILVQAEKQREFADWREAEQVAEIILHPWRFVLPDPPPAIDDDSPHSRWLHDPAALRLWTATLDARQAQFRALDQALATAVGDAEEMVLPLLRNILIMESVAPGSSLAAKADWLDRRLLIDMRTDGCHMTTRVSQAIETLQRFVRGIYTDEHLDLMQHLTLDSDQDYEAEWPVLGAYATWRAFTLAYLYPENLLHLVPPLSRSFGFSRLRGKLPTRISPADACAAADSYAEYFRDVCHLQVQASCQVKTIVAGKGGCGAVVSVLRSRVHMFAVATTSSTVYTASFDGYKDAEDTLDSWQPVPGFENVLEIIGAVPHETPTHQRLILLFAKVRERSANRLMVASFDLDTLSWGKPRELDLPPGTGSDFTAVAVQKRHGSPRETVVFTPGVSPGASDVPTILALRAPGGRVYIRNVSSSASHWAGDEWIPLFGPLIAERAAEVCALIQTGAHDYLLILRNDDGWLKYRSFSTEPAVSRDDGFWRSIARGTFAGALLWPGTSEVFVFYEATGATRYAIVGPPVDLLPGGSTKQSITALDGWLTSVVGVSLDSFHIDISRTWTFSPLPDTDDDHRPLSAIEVEIPFKGSLKKLLQMSVSQWDGKDSLPSGHDYLMFTDDAYLEGLQAEGLREFRDRLSAISNFQGSLGDWKLADWYTRQFADGKGLASAVEDAFNSDATTFRFRGFSSEATLVGTASSDSWDLVPSGGDEEPGPPTRKAVALRTSDGTFRMKIRRAGNTLSAPALRRVTPDGNGPFELGPLAAKEDLQLRRVQIKDFYQSVAGAPPSVVVYLKEAFNLVPLHLGFELQRNGFYDEALLWYRQVYDYQQTAGKQKIDHSLKAEESLALGYDEAEAWLGDASNAHAIAATRKNTYTRHALLAIIRCLIDFGDRLFSRDNVTDNARARDLYKSALLLLGSTVLKPGPSSCAEIIGELEIELASGQLPVSQFQAVLAEIQDPDSLRKAIASLKAISGDPNRGTVERVTSMREVVGSVVAEAPPPRTMGGVLDAKRLTYNSLENHYLGDLPSRALLQSVHQGRRQARLQAVADVARVPEEALLREGTPLPWLRAARSSGGDDAADERLVEFAVPRLTGSPRLAVFDRVRAAEPLRTLSMSPVGGIALNTGMSFDFCIPQNPVVSALRRRAENNLQKLRTCRNIAGMERELDPYGAPIGLGSGLVSPDGKMFSGIVDAPPTPYRYAALVARAKELVNVAQQIESGYQTALENAEREALSTLQAEQSVEQAAARVTLQDLRLNQAHSELGLAQLQKGSAVLRKSTYADWIAGGKNEHEQTMLRAYQDAGEAQQAANAARTVGQVAGFAAAAIESTAHADALGKIAGAAATGLRSVQAAAAAAEGVATGFAINAQTRAQVASLEASFERRKDEWQLQQRLAALDVQIGEQQIQLARDAIAIGQQERVIAGLEHTHAADVLEFLRSRTFTEEMYRWIASVLENVYRFFLQEATSIAHLAELTLAFQRQQSPLNVIQSDYWNVAADESGTIAAGARVDRLGLTGSARLLKDLYQLDQYGFETRQRKQALTITLDLARQFPAEFQRFRERGTLIFETPSSLIDRQLPGAYLCLIQQVGVSVVALVPPTDQIRASLTSAGISRVVVGADTFQTVTIRNLPERVVLTAATTAAGVIELEPDAQSLLRPFEGSGVDTLWELRMPRAANAFDYNTIATVLFTIDLTALHSADYERQVIEAMDRRLTADRAFRFREEFADAWYDLHNPDQIETPMTVRFETRRNDYPPNLDDLRLQHVTMYFVMKNAGSSPVPVDYLHFTPDGAGSAVGGGSTTVESVIGTRRGNGSNWLPMIGQPPFGAWELAFPDTPEMRSRFANDEIADILLVLTIEGETPAWPA